MVQTNPLYQSNQQLFLGFLTTTIAVHAGPTTVDGIPMPRPNALKDLVLILEAKEMNMKTKMKKEKITRKDATTEGRGGGGLIMSRWRWRKVLEF
uniref:Uncharacterized protein n=1 Tax=Cannabis sativa TaxID=3483 RepID=A0A803QWE8_CANSA